MDLRLQILAYKEKEECQYDRPPLKMQFFNNNLQLTQSTVIHWSKIDSVSGISSSILPIEYNSHQKALDLSKVPDWLDRRHLKIHHQKQRP